MGKLGLQTNESVYARIISVIYRLLIFHKLYSSHLNTLKFTEPRYFLVKFMFSPRNLSYRNILVQSNKL
jgi:hypothetical protein